MRAALAFAPRAVADSLAVPRGEAGWFDPLLDIASMRHEHRKRKAVYFMKAVRIGIGGPVGSGKTMLVLRFCQWLRGEFSIGVITNDIYTREDAEFLVRNNALPPDRVIGVETGGCPHTAIRDDTSMNLAAVGELLKRHTDLQVIFIESGGDNLRHVFAGAGRVVHLRH